eukprot:2253273-Amphidinium_carterae.2
MLLIAGVLIAEARCASHPLHSGFKTVNNSVGRLNCLHQLVAKQVAFSVQPPSALGHNSQQLGMQRVQLHSAEVRVRLLYGSTTGTAKKWAQTVGEELSLWSGGLGADVEVCPDDSLSVQTNKRLVPT